MDQVGTPTEWESRGEGGGTCPVVSTKLHLGETVGVGWLVDGWLVDVVGWLICKLNLPKNTQTRKKLRSFQTGKDGEHPIYICETSKKRCFGVTGVEIPRFLPSNLRISGKTG